MLIFSHSSPGILDDDPAEISALRQQLQAQAKKAAATNINSNRDIDTAAGRRRRRDLGHESGGGGGAQAHAVSSSVGVDLRFESDGGQLSRREPHTVQTHAAHGGNRGIGRRDDSSSKDESGYGGDDPYALPTEARQQTMDFLAMLRAVLSIVHEEAEAQPAADKPVR